MSTPAVVWLVVGLVTTVAVSAMLIALVRHILVLGRALRRFQDEVAPLARDIGAEGDRAARRSTHLPIAGADGASRPGR
ncbi:MAG TPA: hypothetical protein VE669_01955 [Actinomycetota bacterium]|nr:hypothetical protein [Actinomycetota bacterium]